MRLNPTFPSKSLLTSREGVIATSQPLASATGIEILRKGGTAADACIAAAAVLNVTEPTSTGIGGDVFVLYYKADEKKVYALNGSGRVPNQLSLLAIQSVGYKDGLPPFHPYTITVPGACAAWFDLNSKFGNLSMSNILAPAIRLADEGFPVEPLTSYYWTRGAEQQLSTAIGGEQLTLNGRAPFAGEHFINSGLANTFRTISEFGKEAFYEGMIADNIVKTIQDSGGLMNHSDLASHTSTWETPISTTYRDTYRVWECPPNGQGLTALIALNIIENLDFPSLHVLSARKFHLLIEALRLAFVDAQWHIADPAFNTIPLDDLLSKEYARKRSKLIHSEKVNLQIQKGLPYSSSDTVYLTAVDNTGNACSFINSNYMGFGTGIVPGKWGFTLQNRGHNFSLEEGHPNMVEPGKRPYHTIIPAMATYEDTGDLFASFGVMGGFMQPQGHVQVLSNMVDYGMDPQTALDTPRFCIDASGSANNVSIEDGYPNNSILALEKMGHDVLVVEGYGRAVFGRGQIILKEKDSNILTAGSDIRADGCAMATDGE